MFDLIEESLSTQESTPPGTATTPPLKTDSVSVFTMPDKFLPKVTNKPISPVLVAIVIVLVLGSAAAGVYYFVTQDGGGGSLVDLTPATPVAQQEPVATPTPTTPETTTPETPRPTSPQPSGENTQPSVAYVDSLDSDHDGLSDVEEQLFSTDSTKPDTDGDGFLDAEEVKSLYDPTKSGKAKLSDSSLVSLFSNSTFNYKLLYPSSWVSKAVDATTNREILLSSATGEFMSILVQDNPEKLSAIDWYASVKSPGFDTSKLQTLVLDKWSGVSSEDGMELTLTQKDANGQTRPYVYVVTYAPGGKTELSFRSTFQMLVRSIMSSM